MNVGEKINIEQVQKGREMNHADIIKFLGKHGRRFWCWGAHAWVKMSDATLRFMVSGLKHKGHVYIRLNGLDYFDIYLTTTQGTIKQVFTDIGIENLFSVLDENIEISA